MTISLGSSGCIQRRWMHPVKTVQSPQSRPFSVYVTATGQGVSGRQPAVFFSVTELTRLAAVGIYSERIDQILFAHVRAAGLFGRPWHKTPIF